MGQLSRNQIVVSTQGERGSFRELLAKGYFISRDFYGESWEEKWVGNPMFSKGQPLHHYYSLFSWGLLQPRIIFIRISNILYHEQEAPIPSIVFPRKVSIIFGYEEKNNHLDGGFCSKYLIKFFLLSSSDLNWQ